MVWSAHDNNFKALNSELSRKCERVHAERSSGISLAGIGLNFRPMEEEDGWAGGMKEEILDGQTLGGIRLGPIPKLAAAAAAIKRMDAIERIENFNDAGANSSGGRTRSGHWAWTLSTVHSPTWCSYTEYCSVDDVGENTHLEKNEHPLSAGGEDHDISMGEGNSDEPAPASEWTMGRESEGNNTPSSTEVEATSACPNSSDSMETEPGVLDKHPQKDDNSHYDSVLPEAEPALERISKARSAVCALTALPRDRAQDTLKTIEKILTNALRHPGVDKFRSIRVNNSAFSQKVGCYPDAVSLMKLFGFVEEGYPVNPMLKLRREDPGLLWLGLSIVNEGLYEIESGREGNACC